MNARALRSIRRSAAPRQIPIAGIFDDPAGIFDGCTRPQEAKKVVEDTVFEARVVGFAIGALLGVVLGAAGSFVLHTEHKRRSE